MRFGKAGSDQFVVDFAGKGYIEEAIAMKMADLARPQPEFDGIEAMRRFGRPRPCGDGGPNDLRGGRESHRAYVVLILSDAIPLPLFLVTDSDYRSGGSSGSDGSESFCSRKKMKRPAPMMMAAPISIGHCGTSPKTR